MSSTKDPWALARSKLKPVSRRLSAEHRFNKDVVSAAQAAQVANTTDDGRNNNNANEETDNNNNTKEPATGEKEVTVVTTMASVHINAAAHIASPTSSGQLLTEADRQNQRNKRRVSMITDLSAEHLVKYYRFQSRCSTKCSVLK